MKKIFLVVMALIAVVLVCCGCGNRQIFDNTFRFNKAVIRMPDGSCIRGTIENWIDFESGDEIQIKIDGKTYLTHYSNVVMIAE